MAAIAALTSPRLQAASNPASQGMDVRLSVLSSPAHWESGGDARIEVRAAPGLQDKLQVLLNGAKADVALKKAGSHSVQGVFHGLRDGSNTLEVYVKGQSPRETLTLINWPITGPMCTGPH